MKRWLAIFLLIFAVRVNAHEVRPAFLELTERAPGEFDVLWKMPMPGGVPLAGEDVPHPQPAPLADDPGATKTMPCGCPAPTAAQLSRGVLPIHPSLPKDAVTVALPRVERIFGAEIKRWTIQAPHGLDGWEVAVHGLPATMVDVLVRIAMKDGRVVSRVLRPVAPSFVFTTETAGPAVGGYFRLGVEHILLGVDHLLFVLGLILIVRCRWMLLKTITAFTIAHSITLGIATLGYASAPLPPLNAAIALSILFLGPEIVRVWRGDTSLTIRYPWLVAFAFGLLHGFGFASGLKALGLPHAEIPLALLLFNVGVEVGQVFFVGIVLAMAWSWRQLEVRWPRWALATPGYTVGTLGAFWTIQRVAVLLGFTA